MEKINANGNIILTDEQKEHKIQLLEDQFEQVLSIMGYDLNDQQIEDTPKRIAKMWVNEFFQGNYTEAPSFTVFDNTQEYDEMVFLGPIQVKSTCSHHFVPFLGEAYIAYIPDTRVVGISKLARIVKWFMRRPQIQEELTKQITDYIDSKLQPKGIAVYIEAQHLCMTARGVEEYSSKMKTSALRGVFHEDGARQEFFNMVKNK